MEGQWGLRAEKEHCVPERCSSDFPPAEHKQPTEWSVGPHTPEALIGLRVRQEAGWKVISWSLPNDEFLFCGKDTRFLLPEFRCQPTAKKSD